VIKDNALRGTSAWANAFLGRDHTARARKRWVDRPSAELDPATLRPP